MVPREVVVLIEDNLNIKIIYFSVFALQICSLETNIIIFASVLQAFFFHGFNGHLGTSCEHSGSLLAFRTPPACLPKTAIFTFPMLPASPALCLVSV